MRLLNQIDLHFFTLDIFSLQTWETVFRMNLISKVSQPRKLNKPEPFGFTVKLEIGFRKNKWSRLLNTYTFTHTHTYSVISHMCRPKHHMCCFAPLDRIPLQLQYTQHSVAAVMSFSTF